MCSFLQSGTGICHYAFITLLFVVVVVGGGGGGAAAAAAVVVLFLSVPFLRTFYC